MTALSRYRPPPGWVEVPSRVDGVSVFAPPPAHDGPTGPVRTTCPQCGAPMAFDPTRQALACEACDHAEARADAVGAIEVARGHEFTLEALRRGAQGWGVARKTLHCGGCGTDLSVDAGQLAATCAFCGSNQVQLVEADAAAVRPGFVLPFQVKDTVLAARIKAFLTEGWLHPTALRELARLDRFVAVYLPYWLFDARFRADYECEVGKEHTVTRTDSDGHRHTETEIRWSWTKGHVDRAWSGVPISGTGRLSSVLLQRTERTFDFGGMVAYNPKLLAGYRAQSYDIALPEAWNAGKAKIRELGRALCESDAKSGRGEHVRNLTLQAAMDDEVWRYVLLPVYLTTYQFEGRAFQVMINGQSGEVNGQKPVVWGRVYALTALMWSIVICTGVTSLPLTLIGIGAFGLVLTAVFLVLAFIGTGWLWSHAREAEAA